MAVQGEALSPCGPTGGAGSSSSAGRTLSLLLGPNTDWRPGSDQAQQKNRIMAYPHPAEPEGRGPRVTRARRFSKKKKGLVAQYRPVNSATHTLSQNSFGLPASAQPSGSQKHWIHIDPVPTPAVHWDPAAEMSAHPHSCDSCCTRR